jgi:hypothetical protein
MTFKKIGVMSPGSMGQAIAQQLQSNRFAVCTPLDGCSACVKYPRSRFARCTGGACLR